MSASVLPCQVLQASLVGTVRPTLHGILDPEPEGPVLGGPGDESCHSTNTAQFLLPGDPGEARPMAQAKLDALLHGGPQALLCLLRPTVCPSWCPSPTDSHSSCGHPSIQVAPCPLPTWDNPHRSPWPRFSLMTAFSLLVLGGKGPRGRLVCPDCFLGAQKLDLGDMGGGCWALRSGCFWV